MQELINIIILSTVQGITEFLPISSSGHLVILKDLLGVQAPGAQLEVALHFGTLLSILIYYRKEIWRLLKALNLRNHAGEYIRGRRFIAYIIIGSLPAGVIGLLFKDNIESLFTQPIYSSFALVLTGLFLIITWLSETYKPAGITTTKSLLVGVSQALAIIPGFSRSGWTIGTARLLKIQRERAAELSFFLAIPALFGALMLKIMDATDADMGQPDLMLYLFGILIAAVIGYYSLKLLISILKKKGLYLFGPYCIIVGIIGIIIF